MKKLFLLFAAAGLLLASCSSDDNGYENGDNGNGNGNGNRKLPSKISFSAPAEDGSGLLSWYMQFEYDDQKRLVKYIEQGTWARITHEFLYETGNFPTKIIINAVHNSDGTHSFTNKVEIEYTGNQIIITQNFEGVDESRTSTQTLIVNANNQLINSGAGVFEYNSNGNISTIVWEDAQTVTFVYSNAKAVFRYANVPSWLMQWFFEGFFPEQGYMPAGIYRDGERTMTLTYTLEGDFVKTRTWISGDWEEVSVFEYINAK